MIDESDGDFALLMSNGGGPVWGLICIAIAIALYIAAANNAEECSARHCPTGQRARLLDHECVCTSEPEP